MAIGGEAQRVNRTQEVAGSSPASSTRKRPAQQAFFLSSAEGLDRRELPRGQVLEVLVTATVRDLVAGSGIDFGERAQREVQGGPGAWKLYAAPRWTAPIE